MTLNKPVHVSWPLSLPVQNGEHASTAPTGLARAFGGLRLRARLISQHPNGSWNPQAKGGDPVAVGLVLTDPSGLDKRKKADLGRKWP